MVTTRHTTVTVHCSGGVLASTLLYPDISGEFELGWAPIELETKVHPKVRDHREAPTMTFSWMKAATTAFTFKNLLSNYTMLINHVHYDFYVANTFMLKC